MKSEKKKKNKRRGERTNRLLSLMPLLILIILALLILILMANFIIKAKDIYQYKNSCEACVEEHPGLKDCLDFERNRNKKLIIIDFNYSLIAPSTKLIK